jgi:hypothetical protein
MMYLVFLVERFTCLRLSAMRYRVYPEDTILETILLSTLCSFSRHSSLCIEGEKRDTNLFFSPFAHMYKVLTRQRDEERERLSINKCGLCLQENASCKVALALPVS